MTIDNYTNILRIALSEKKGTFINSSGMEKKIQYSIRGLFIREREVMAVMTT